MTFDQGFSVLGDSISTLGGANPSDWRTHYEGEVNVDGITAPEDTWWGKVIDHFGGHLVGNASYSGSVVEGFGFPAAVSDQRIAALLGANGDQPDVVLVYMGINDYGWGGGRNQVMGGSKSASARPEDFEGPREVVLTVSREALERFQTAYALMLKKVHALAPNADVWCLTHAPGTCPTVANPCFAYSVRGIELDKYNQAIACAALAAGAWAHLADIRAYGVDYDAVDGTHPSALGMRQIAAMAIAQMEGKPVRVDELPVLKGAQRSQRTCFAATCEGCPKSGVTETSWTLICEGA